VLSVEREDWVRGHGGGGGGFSNVFSFAGGEGARAHLRHEKEEKGG